MSIDLKWASSTSIDSLVTVGGFGCFSYQFLLDLDD